MEADSVAEGLSFDCLVAAKEWFTVYDQYRRTHCVVSDLIMGNEYVFRVFANNLVGPSQEPCGTKDSAYIQKTGGQQSRLRSVSSSGRRRLTPTPSPRLCRGGVQTADPQGTRPV